MAKKKYFIIKDNKVKEKLIDYKFNAGFSVTQKQKNIKNINFEIFTKEGNEHKILEVSSKSLEDIGVKLSAFNLCIKTKKGLTISVESIFQASKVFENGGPYKDLLLKTSREAKKDERLKNSGNLTKFSYQNEDWELEPKTMFYDWIYINSVWLNIKNKTIDIEEFIERDIFTDVEFNHEKSFNCQARSLALFVILYKNNVLEECIENKNKFKSICKEIYSYEVDIPKEEINKTIQMSFENMLKEIKIIN